DARRSDDRAAAATAPPATAEAAGSPPPTCISSVFCSGKHCYQPCLLACLCSLLLSPPSSSSLSHATTAAAARCIADVASSPRGAHLARQHNALHALLSSL
ncbi:unnamed protein product, partial [Closterium sp. Yama58-4]